MHDDLTREAGGEAAKPGRMMDQDIRERLDKCLEVALENRKLEIDLVWKRTAVFWVFVGAIFVGVMQVLDRKELLSASLALVGLVFSLIWTLANRGGKFWQENWELKAEHFFRERYGYSGLLARSSKKTGDPSFFTLRSRFVTLRARQYSVSGLLVALSDLVVLFWIGLLLHIVRSRLPVPVQGLLAWAASTKILLLGTLLYCVYVFVWCRTSKNEPETDAG